MSLVKRALPYILILTVILAALWLNAYCIRQVNPANVPSSSASLTAGGTVWSIDNIHYDKQFRNWMEHNSFSSETAHPEYRVRRTPLYPLFLGAPIYFLGEKAGFTFIWVVQTALHLLAAFLFGQIIFSLTSSRRLRNIGVLVYGLCPFIFIYTNYTITESLTPFFATTVLYCFVRYCYSPQKNMWLILTGIALGLATLHRPLIILYALPLGLYVCFRNGLISNIRQQALHGFVFAAAFLFTLSPWIIRNYIVAKEIVITEKWYYEDPMFYGRSHTYLRTWVNSFTNPANALSTEVLVEQLRSSPDTSSTARIIEQYIAAIPDWVLLVNKRDEVESALRQYADCQQNRVALSDANPGISLEALGNRACEYESKDRFARFTAAIKERNPLRYHVLLPGKTLLRDGMAHSFSSPWAMLNATCLSKGLVIPIKAAFFLFNVALWASLLIYVVRRKKPFDRGIALSLIGAVLVFVGFHIFIFRYFESRYFLPFYPILMIFFVLNFNMIPYRKKTSGG